MRWQTHCKGDIEIIVVRNELTEIIARKPSTRECSAYDDDDFEDVDVEVF